VCGEKEKAEGPIPSMPAANFNFKVPTNLRRAISVLVPAAQEI
jgi:hypothetical protein